jgi:CheY-like chemotaxis protein
LILKRHGAILRNIQWHLARRQISTPPIANDRTKRKSAYRGLFEQRALLALRKVPSFMGKSATILVVEDEPVVREGVVQLLDHAGYRVFDTFNATDALKLLAEHPEISVLLTDVSMAGMSGMELAREARTIRPDLRVVLTSGRGNLEVAEPFHFLPKPWRAGDLDEILRKA